MDVPGGSVFAPSDGSAWAIDAKTNHANSPTNVRIINNTFHPLIYWIYLNQGIDAKYVFLFGQHSEESRV